MRSKPRYLPVILLTSHLLILHFFSHGQQNGPDCTQWKEGTFYMYPKNSSTQFSLRRAGEFQYETELLTGDTALYKVEWLKDCRYALKYLSGSVKQKPEIATFLKKHRIVLEIEKTTSDYYVMKEYIDKVAGTAIGMDTIWANRKADFVSNERFRMVTDTRSLKRAHFTDTSSYALLYFYRPEKLGAYLAELSIYFDDNLTRISKNNTAYIFKVLKEGPLRITSHLFNQKPSELKMAIEFGKKYFVRSTLRFVVTSLSGWRSDLNLEPPDKGQAEFDVIPLTK